MMMMVGEPGFGSILLQIIDGKRRVIKMWSKQWKTLHMKRAPPYYKETAAWMKGMECARIYSDSSKFPIQCVTDHTPLTYVKNTSGKGPVSQFILDNLSYLDYTITYRPGKKLVEADSVSRFPCLGPLELSPDGVKEAFDVLLAAIPEEWNTKKRVWINAQKETELIQQMVRQWMSTLPSIPETRRVPYVETPTKERILKIDYGIAIWSPPADNLKELINTALEKDHPFACLVPSCLVHQLPGTRENRSRMKNMTKIVMLQPEVTWLIHGIKTMKHQVLSIQQETENTFTELEDLRGIVRKAPDWNLSQWIPLQEKMVKENPECYTKSTIFRRNSDGFVLYKPGPDRTLALVPPKYVEELINWQHQRLCHGGFSRVFHALVKHWHWINMKGDVRRIVENCAACQLLKAKRVRAHHHFRAKIFCLPRTIWGCDFYGIQESRNKYNNLLGAIDLATAECRLFACQERSAATVSKCILHGIVLRDGCPLHIHSDARNVCRSTCPFRHSFLPRLLQTRVRVNCEL